MNKSQILFLTAFTAVVGACSQYDQASGGSPDSHSGCRYQEYGICWDPPAASETGVVPAQGDYTVVPAEIDVEISPLDTYGFDVRLVYSTGTRLCVYFSADDYRFDCVEIVNGAFAHTHGGGADNTNCPTEGYIISGSFVSPNEARGNFQFVPSCHVTNVGDFIARYRE